MKKRRPLLTVSYRILNGSGDTVEVFKLTGHNKAYLNWKAKRMAETNHGKEFKLHAYKIVEETV